MTTTALAPTAEIALEVHICNQRRSYTAVFATEDQAVTFIAGRSSTHAFHEIETRPIPQACTRLIEALYPICEHGMAGDCYGPQHYYLDDEERAAGFGF